MKVEPGKIHWSNVITYNPKVGLDLSGDLPQGGIPIPAYGDFGGPQNTHPKKTVGVDALDTLFRDHDLALDVLFKDDGVITPGEVQPFISAHVTLITEVTKLQKDSDGLLRVDLEGKEIVEEGSAEATLYAGLTNLALTHDLALLPHNIGLTALESALEDLDFLNLPDSPGFDNVLGVVSQAVENMETGFAELPGVGKSLHGAAAYFEGQLIHLLTPSDTSDFG
jgi:hypothetical protein